jgi:serine/threonine protein phosphatase PrpC
MRFLRRRRAEESPISATGITDVGNVRSSNEDNFTVLLGPDAPLGDALLAVADGMGGHSAGEVASQISLDALAYALSDTSSPTKHSLREAVEVANRRVYFASSLGNLHGMGTTLVVGLLVGSLLHVCNVGDSRAYLLRAGRLMQLTRDHSWVGDMVDKGFLTPEQASAHPRRNVITRALGVGESVQVDVTRIILRKGDRMLFCSDGLHGLVDDGTIAAILSRKSLRGAARELVRSAKRAGGDDNITVIVAQMDSAVQVVQSENIAESPEITLPPR